MNEPRMTDPDVDIFSLIPETKTPKKAVAKAASKPTTKLKRLIVLFDENADPICVVEPVVLPLLTIPNDQWGSPVANPLELPLITGANVAEAQKLLNDLL